MPIIALPKKSMHCIVYHQFRRNCISPTTELLHLIIAEVYIQPAADYIRPTAIIFTLLRDDIPLLSQWIKKDPTNRLSLFYGPSDRNKYNRKCLPRILRCAHVTSSSARRLKNAPQEPFYLRKFRWEFSRHSLSVLEITTLPRLMERVAVVNANNRSP